MVATPDPVNELTRAANAIAEKWDRDVLFFNSPINRPLDGTLIEDCRKRRRRKSVLLVLVTLGGDPDAAYRIARCLQEKYEQVICLVPGPCKSAGTLVVVGGQELVIADAGELGPLDVQMSKQDELLQRQSGLTATAALETLHERAYDAFEHFLFQVVLRTGVSTRAAMQTAVQLTTGLFTHTYAHVDPMHVGEAGRAMKISQKYGEILLQKGLNIESQSLTELIQSYPSHGFIIDRTEAKRHFKNVREPNDLELKLLETLGQQAIVPQAQSMILFVSDEIPAGGSKAVGTTSATTKSDEAPHVEQPIDSNVSKPTEHEAPNPGGDAPAAENADFSGPRAVSGAA